MGEPPIFHGINVLLIWFPSPLYVPCMAVVTEPPVNGCTPAPPTHHFYPPPPHCWSRRYVRQGVVPILPRLCGGYYACSSSTSLPPITGSGRGEWYPWDLPPNVLVRRKLDPLSMAPWTMCCTLPNCGPPPPQPPRTPLVPMTAMYVNCMWATYSALLLWHNTYPQNCRWLGYSIPG